MPKTVTLEEHQRKLAEGKDLALDLIEKHVGGVISTILAETSQSLAPVYQGGGGGTLQASIRPFPSVREGDTVTCGMSTNVRYAIFQEYGTGNKGDGQEHGIAHTSKTHWTYFDQRVGGFRTGKPQPPKRFMRDSIAMNKDNIKQMLAGAFTEVLL